MDNKKVIEFYNEYVDQQQDVGINERIYEMYRRLKKQGLHPGSNILELGCGIGTLTYLLAKTVKSGCIESVDISTQSIEFAKQRLKQRNLYLEAHDVVDYIPKLKNIDFITLFDVIEHIPMERHDELFRNLAKIVNDKTVILINIPSPAAIQYDIDNNPAALQVIDQPLPIEFIVNNIVKNGLSLLSFENHSIWAENDYQFFIIGRNKKYTENKLSSKRNFFEKVVNKIKRTFVQLRHRYK
ncbi:MAG: class I SAM-dependent methyltransferase [Bacteroidetes bacterium]|nr:class I SAM-dependent methyltransferase [Bacteroidota bacterium]